MFDLVNDIGESKDLSTTQPEIAARMLKELKEWATTVNAPTPTQLNPAFNPKAKKQKKKNSKPASKKQPKADSDKARKKQPQLSATQGTDSSFQGEFQ